MARRRIELPPVDELFGEERSTAARSTSAAAKRTAPKKDGKPAPKEGKQKAAAKKSAKRSSTPKKPKSPAAKRTRRSPEARLSAVEQRLTALPVESLIDLRDGLEDLLAADTVDEAAVTRLLDRLGA